MKKTLYTDIPQQPNAKTRVLEFALAVVLVVVLAVLLVLVLS